MQNLNLYHVFYTVAQCRNISAAAKQLYISQPAISKSISKLEENLNTALFLRSSKGVRLTAEGELLYKQLTTAFQAIKEGEDSLKRNEELGVGTLSIGVSTTLCKYILIPYLQEFITRYPHIKVSISCQPSYQTIAALENGSLDIGLIGEAPHISKLSFYPVKEIQDVLVTTEEYKQKLQFRDGLHLEDATLLLLDRNNISRQYVEKYLLMQNLTFEQQVEVSTMDLLIEFAKIGLGVGCVIKDFVAKELESGALTCVPLKTPIPCRKIGFAYKAKANPTVSMQKFMNLWTSS